MSRVVNDRECYNCGRKITELEGSVSICPDCRTVLSGVAVYYTIDDLGQTNVHYPNGKVRIIPESNLNNRRRGL